MLGGGGGGCVHFGVELWLTFLWLGLRKGLCMRRALKCEFAL